MNQLDKDIGLLHEATHCGPSRYDQLVPDIYDLYQRHEIDPKQTTPARALALLRKQRYYELQQRNEAEHEWRRQAGNVNGFGTG